MPPNILLTGGSGYIGGSLQTYLKHHPLPAEHELFALVRTAAQAAQTWQAYGITPVFINLENEDAIYQFLLKHEVTIVVFFIAPAHSENQLRIIRSLAKIGKPGETHFIHTSGAKGFSSHADFPLEPPVADDDERMHDIHKANASKIMPLKLVPRVDTAIVEEAEAHAVNAYIIAPCMVYGEGTGFGNRTSIQTVAVVKAALATRHVYDPNKSPTSIWPVCCISDQITQLDLMLRQIISGSKHLDSNRKGYYLISPGAVPWRDIYAAMAKPLYQRGLIDDGNVVPASQDDKALTAMAKGLGVPGPTEVLVGLGGECTWKPQHARKLGWAPAHVPEHILETAEDEVKLILQKLES